MKVLKILDPAELLQKYRLYRDFGSYLRDYLTGYKNYSLISLDLGDFENLLLNSSFKKQYPKRGEFPLMKEVLREVNENPTYLDTSHPDRGLSGTTVKTYLNKFKEGTLNLTDCFVREKDSDMMAEGSLYISDGMHRLVAYGLYSKLSKDYFPIETILAQTKI